MNSDDNNVIDIELARGFSLADETAEGFGNAFCGQTPAADASLERMVGWATGMLARMLDAEALTASRIGITVLVSTAHGAVEWTSTLQRGIEQRAALQRARKSPERQPSFPQSRSSPLPSEAAQALAEVVDCIEQAVNNGYLRELTSRELDITVLVTVPTGEVKISTLRSGPEVAAAIDTALQSLK